MTNNTISKNKIKKDLLASIRNGEVLDTNEKLSLVVNLSIPAILAQLTSIIMQYIDASMVGHIGQNNAASIGLVASTTWLFSCITSALSAGFYILATQKIGAKDFAAAKKIRNLGFGFVMPIALIISLTGVLISTALPGLLGGDVSIRSGASIYFKIYVLSIPAMAINSLSGGLLQGSGNMKIPSILNSLTCILDVILNAFFIFPSQKILLSGNEFTIPCLGLGITGAALGSILAEYIVAGLMLYFLLFRSRMLGISHKSDENSIENETTTDIQNKKDTSHSSYLLSALKLSFPIVLENVIICSAYVVSTRITAPLGVVAIAANSFAITAESLCYMPGYGIGSAATTLSGQSYGAGRNELVKSFGKLTIAFGMIIMAVSGALMFFFAPFMMGLLTPDKAVIALGVKVLRIEAFAEPLYGASIVANGNLRGVGDTLIPSIMNLVSMWCVRLPLAYILSNHYGLTGVWIAMCFELCFRGTIFLIRFFTNRNLNHK